MPAGLVLKQPDLGTVLTLVLITATLMFAGGLNLRTMGMLALAAVLAAPVAMALPQALPEGARW